MSDNMQVVKGRAGADLASSDISPTKSMSPDESGAMVTAPASSQRLPPRDYVKLNVGGCLFYTTITTLTKHPDTMLAAMFSGRLAVHKDTEGWIIIDRNGRHFGTILNYLRDDSCTLPETLRGVRELLAEAKYYCIGALADSCERVLAKRERESEQPICRVPLITSQKEESILIGSSNKPVVKLLINRHNNKYSYTPTSDDNLLKNIELFDKLSLQFSSRILFIKDVVGSLGSNEICCWSFYQPFNGKKVAEVCCTSIVYATDKKHTKVEYPEARIYEETLKIILYEDKPAPEQDIVSVTTANFSAMMMPAGGSRAAGGAISSYTSDEEEDRPGFYRLRLNNKQNP